MCVLEARSPETGPRVTHTDTNTDEGTHSSEQNNSDTWQAFENNFDLTFFNNREGISKTKISSVIGEHKIRRTYYIALIFIEFIRK